MVGNKKEIINWLLEQDNEKKFVIKETKKRRSNNANSYFHLLCNKLARYYNVSDEEMKINMNLAYGTIATDDNGKVLGCKLPKGVDAKQFYPYSKYYKTDIDGCDCYLFYKRTHVLDRKEFAQLIDGVTNECKDAGIETLDEIELNSLLDNYNVTNS